MFGGIAFIKAIWLPFISEQLNCRRETSNTQDSYAVMVTRIKDAAMVGHVPCFMLAVYSTVRKRNHWIMVSTKWCKGTQVAVHNSILYKFDTETRCSYANV